MGDLRANERGRMNIKKDQRGLQTSSCDSQKTRGRVLMFDPLELLKVAIISEEVEGGRYSSVAGGAAVLGRLQTQLPAAVVYVAAVNLE